MISSNYFRLFCILFAFFTSIEINAAPIIQPSSPGLESREIDQDAAIEIADTSYIEQDVLFLQQMIVHHDQALTLSRLAPERTNSKNILDLAAKIDSSQADEIDFMKSWLLERNENIQQMHHHHDGSSMNMAGMATQSQINELSSYKGVDFDKLFLKLMINHHDGAIKMVDTLRKHPGSAYDEILNDFVNDVTNDQEIEIELMNGLLINLSSDPRASLSSGLYHADEAILNLELLASLKKPAGFFDPNNEKELRPQNNNDDSGNDAE